MEEESHTQQIQGDAEQELIEDQTEYNERVYDNDIQNEDEVNSNSDDNVIQNEYEVNSNSDENDIQNEGEVNSNSDDNVIQNEGEVNSNSDENDIQNEGEVNSNSDENVIQNDGEVNSNSVENDVQTEGENPNCDNNSETSEGSNTTEQEYSMKYRNIFRIPEKLSNEKIQSLLHCSKKQFLHYVESLRPHLKGRNEFLSIYSRVFLFRFKV